MRLKKMTLTCLISVCLFQTAYAEQAKKDEKKLVWWSIHGGYKYSPIDKTDAGHHAGDFYTEIGLQYKNFDLSFNISPPALLIAVVTRLDAGIRFYELDYYIFRFFSGFGRVDGTVSEKRFINIGLDVGLKRSRGSCGCLWRDDNIVYLSVYLERFFWEFWERVVYKDSICIGAGVRW